VGDVQVEVSLGDGGSVWPLALQRIIMYGSPKEAHAAKAALQGREYACGSYELMIPSDLDGSESSDEG
jgi:hypothetical protein